VVKILFVCLGNICRSPAAEGIFRALASAEGLADRIEIDSAGTSGWNIGRPPDSRAQAAIRRRGIDISGLRARRTCSADFRRFDYLVAMDVANLLELSAACPAATEDRLHLLLDFAPETGCREVPDPYYGGPEGFETMLDLIEAGATGLLHAVRARHFPNDRSGAAATGV